MSANYGLILLRIASFFLLVFVQDAAGFVGTTSEATADGSGGTACVQKLSGTFRCTVSFMMPQILTKIAPVILL